VRFKKTTADKQRVMSNASSKATLKFSQAREHALDLENLLRPKEARIRKEAEDNLSSPSTISEAE
jgi:hypothetical protein